MRRLSMIVAVLLAAWLAVGLSASADDRMPSAGNGNMMEKSAFRHQLYAQADDDSPRGPGRGWGRNRAEWMKQRKHLEQLRMLKMLELLNLDEDQEVPFLTAFRKMRSNISDLDEQSGAIIDSLASELRAGDVSDTRINSLVDRTLLLQNDKHRLMIDFVEQSRKTLTPEQVGKLVIFQKRFESEILERIGRFRRQMDGGPGGPGGPPDSDG